MAAESMTQEPKIFIDENIAEGHSWPHELAHALGRSKVLVALWTPTYFNSQWCTSELAHMYAREQRCGYRTVEHPHGLIIPALLQNGENFPLKARSIQMKDLQGCANVWLAPDSPKKEELSQRIREWTPQIVQAIRHAPDFDPMWQNLAFDSFLNLFTGIPPEQKILLGLGDA